MNIVRTGAILLLLFLGSWVLWSNNPTFRDMVKSYVENGEFLTLEARYSPDQIMQANRSALLPDEMYTFQAPSLKFYPYFLMEVKFTQPNGKTKEGVILWSMVDGEMVLDTDTWQKTHGFEDAINARASRSDFIILNALSKYRGTLPLARLQKELNVDDKQMEQMIEDAKQKYLIIVNGAQASLHFQNPNFNVPPQTRINQWLVTKPYDHAQRIEKQYTASQIERTAKAAFGPDFAIKVSKEVFLPVYSIEVLNPDGSVMTSYWNALNGQRIDTKYLTYSP